MMNSISGLSFWMIGSRILYTTILDFSVLVCMYNSVDTQE